jgi:phospholipid/cholesterol/gamma-HCH transport system substrate-binding protein
METRAHYLLIGIAFAVAVSGILYGIFWFAKIKDRPEYQRYDIFFEASIAGMKPGAEVLYSGIEVGRVVSMSIDTDGDSGDDPLARFGTDGDISTPTHVAVDIDTNFHVRRDIVAMLATEGLVGEVIIEMSLPLLCHDTLATDTSNASGNNSDICENARVVPFSEEIGYFQFDDASGDEFNNRNSRKIRAQYSPLQELMKEAPNVLASASAVLSSASAIMEENRQNIRATLAHIESITSALNNGEDDQGTSTAIPALVASLNRSVGKIETAIEGVGGNIDESVVPALEAFQQMMVDLDQLIVENADAISAFTNGTLGNMGQLVTDLRRMSLAMARLAEKLENDTAGAIMAPARPVYEPDNEE